MIVRAVIPAKRRDFAIGVIVFCSTACTSMLGIDGDYTAGAADRDTGLASGGQDIGSGGLRPAVPASTGGRTGRGDAGSGNGAGPGAGGTVVTQGDSSGGTQPAGGSIGAGGTPGNGGAPASSGGTQGAGTGGSSTGGAPPDIVDAGDDPSGCPTGVFTGSYRGTHKPGNLPSALSAPISGDVVLRFSGTGTGSATVTGTLVDPLTDPTGGVAGALRGTVDCTSGTGTLTIMQPAEVTTIVPVPYVAQVDGSIDVKVGKSSTLSGAFALHETDNAMGTGSGSWTASK